MKHLGQYIIQLGRLQQIYLDRELERYELSGNRYLYLLKTCDKNKITSGQIAKDLHLRSTSVLEIVKILELANYINPAPPYDKMSMGRGKRISINATSKALEVHPKIIQILNNWDDMVLGALSNKEQYEVSKLIISYSDYLKSEKTKDTLHIDESILAILPTLSRIQQQNISLRYKKYPLIKGSKILCLFEMYDRRTFTLKEISNSTMLAHSNLFGIFRQYEKEGYIQRTGKLNKIKSSDVFYITDKAINVWKELDEYFREIDQEILHSTKASYDSTILVLDKLQKAMIKCLD